MNTLESPLERLNYYNGQRLEAGDMRTEQDYHVRVRRWLNKSLYTPGIAAGLDVTVKEGDPHTVIVHPGLALDPEGREIIVVEEVEAPVTGRASEVGAPVLGNYLVLKYAEEKGAPLEESCSNGTGNGVMAWGGPSRIRLEPELWVQNEWPKPDSDLIVLAQLELDENCAVRGVHTSVRQLVGNASPARVRAISLHGEKDIDSANSKKIYFHIENGRPERVTLYLRAAKLSTLFYSELGNHTHELEDLVTDPTATIPAHTHPLDEVVIEESGTHEHKNVTAEAKVENPPPVAIKLQGSTEGEVNLTSSVKLDISGGGHSHTFASDAETGPGGEISSFSLSVSGSVSKTGQRHDIRTTRDPLDWVSDLQIWIDGAEYSEEIRDRLGWARLGDGSGIHKLVTEGTGAIRLDLLGIDFFVGDHDIELIVGGDGNGGQIIYNLYVD